MAEVAKVVAAPSSDSIPGICGTGGVSMASTRPLLKRKTPSQLRDEQLKRRVAVELVNESASPSESANMVESGMKKPEGPKSTKYIGKRLDEVYQARKPTSRLGMVSGKSATKSTQVTEGMRGLKSSLSSNLTLKAHQDLQGTSVAAANATDSISGICQTTEKESQRRFLSVSELSRGTDMLSENGTVDVDKALKGLGARETSGSCSPPSSSGKSGDATSTSLRNFCLELHIPGKKVPLDLTLKKAMRILSSSPVDRLHRLLMRGTHQGMTPFSFQFGCSGNQSNSSTATSSASGDPCSLHSWVYPQSSLPGSVISLLSSSNGGVEMDFLTTRQLAWEDSFRSLYYMLRKGSCNVFYVCTSQFVVMFTAVNDITKGKRTCTAYVSQSTGGLRSLLREHDISYSMPFCCYEVEQISREDLVELSEIEKHNLGQAKRVSSIPDVDNSPKSLLAFKGNDVVHGLYDLLLNYRSILTMLSKMDVPVLCAPTPFVNAALSAPEVRCKEIKRVDALQSKGLAKKEVGSSDCSTGGVCYSIELKDAYLPPWIVSSICSVMGSEGKTFEASFTTEPTSLGLNAALEAVAIKSDNDDTSGDSQDAHTFGVSAALISPDLVSACLKSLKYSDGSYVASLSPI